MKEFLNFLNQSFTAFHAVKNLENLLLNHDFIKLEEGKTWHLETGKNYYIIRNTSSIIAFKIPNDIENVAFNIVASHSDSPAFKMKPNATIKQNNYVKLNTEGYGGMISYSWFDRPLGVAGRIFVENNNQIEEQLINFKETIIIPSLAIHLNRTGELKANPQIDLLPIFSSDASFEDVLQRYATGKIIAHDLFLYNKEEASLIGANQEYIFSSRLDDLECAYTSMKSLIKAVAKNIDICAVFNNEEVGSRSNNGADSTFLQDVVKQICAYLSINYYQALASSFIVSADNAHAVHPNHPEKTDPTNGVYMNQGIVIKHQAGLSYTTDALSEAIFKKICQMANVTYQDYTNRSDERGGSTLGAISLSHMSIPSVDIGLAQLAMHSSVETCGKEDFDKMIKALTKYYEVKITKENGKINIE